MRHNRWRGGCWRGLLLMLALTLVLGLAGSSRSASVVTFDLGITPGTQAFAAVLLSDNSTISASAVDSTNSGRVFITITTPGSTTAVQWAFCDLGDDPREQDVYGGFG